MSTTTITPAPCGKCLLCATFSGARLPRRAPSCGGAACLTAAQAHRDAAIVCSRCGAGVYGGHHSTDLPTQTPCSNWAPITFAEFRKARA